MRGVYLISVWLHIMAAIVWVGGAIFLVVALVPAIRRPRICRGCGRACALVGSEISSRELALLRRSHYRTGGVNLLLRGIGWEDLQSGQFWQASFGRTLAGKLLLVAAILAVSGAPL